MQTSEDHPRRLLARGRDHVERHAAFGAGGEVSVWFKGETLVAVAEGGSAVADIQLAGTDACVSPPRWREDR